MISPCLLLMGPPPALWAENLAGLPQQGIEVLSIDRAQVSSLKPGSCCVLLDGGLNPAVILTQIRQLHSAEPTCKLIVALPDTGMLNATTYLQAGVSGLLNQRCASAQLAAIIRHIAAGHIYLDHDLAQILAMRQIKKMLAPFTALTSREFDVFCLIAEGCSLQTIAEQLAVSSKTVSNCQSQIKLKLGLEGRLQINQLAINNGLISEVPL